MQIIESEPLGTEPAQFLDDLRLLATSSPLVGSSKIKTRGLHAMAVAKPIERVTDDMRAGLILNAGQAQSFRPGSRAATCLVQRPWAGPATTSRSRPGW